MSTIFLGLGSNLRPRENLSLAINELQCRFQLSKKSSVYRNKSLGFEGDDFLNAVVCVETSMSPQTICTHLEKIHSLAGRNPGGDRFRSRTLDIDLLLYDDLVIDRPPVVVPRADILEYSFVLKPLCDLAPGLVHPVTGKTIAVHWRGFDADTHPLTKTDIIL